MKKLLNILFVAFLLLVNVGPLFGQVKRIELGDKLFDQYAYRKAIILYEEALNRNSTNWELYAKLGDCYYYLSDTKKALENYDTYFNKVGNQNKKDFDKALLLRYAVCLNNDGRTSESIEIYKKLGEKVEPKAETDLIDISQSKLERLTAINSDSSDFGTFIYKNTLYFSSTRKNPEKEKRLNKKLYKWNEEPFLDIYEAVIDENNESLSMKPVNSNIYSLKNINTIAHEASVALTKNGDTMYYAGGEVKNNKMVYNKRGAANLKLKRATWDSSLQQWVVSQDTAMNHFDFVNYSIGNPVLSPDYKRLYFVTCAPFSTAQGQTDLYYVNILNGGSSFGKVTSVFGVNTAGRESFPFIASDGTLYFSSDGVYQKTKSDSSKDLGLGLLDIYKVENLDNVIQKFEHDLAQAKTVNDSTEINKKIQNYFEKELVVEHLKNPFNSEWDDFAFFIEKPKDGKNEVYAYFSSNRDGDIRNDDIYRTKVKIESYKNIKVDVTDSLSQKLIGNAFVDLFDSEGKLLKTVQDSTGSYQFKLKVGEDYKVRGYADRYNQDFKTFNSKVIEDPIVLKLKPIPCEFSISNIEFRFNKDTLDINVSADSLELKKLDDLITILMTNRDINIKIESYTDSRGPAAYNLDLSERRAKTTRQYLIEQGVYENQIISAKGFGENCPIVSDIKINELTTNVQREAAHAKNRRSRFILDCQEVLEGCQTPVQNN